MSKEVRPYPTKITKEHIGMRIIYRLNHPEPEEKKYGVLVGVTTDKLVCDLGAKRGVECASEDVILDIAQTGFWFNTVPTEEERSEATERAKARLEKVFGKDEPQTKVKRKNKPKSAPTASGGTSGRGRKPNPNSAMYIAREFLSQNPDILKDEFYGYMESKGFTNEASLAVYYSKFRCKEQE